MSSEIKAVQDFQQKLRGMGRDLYPPADKHIVTLKWRDERVQAGTAELFQFKGREDAKQLLRSEGFQAFERVGTTLSGIPSRELQPV